MWIVFVVLGIIGIVINTNNWFIIPQICINISFIIGGVLFLIQFILMVKANKIQKNIFKRF